MVLSRRLGDHPPSPASRRHQVAVMDLGANTARLVLFRQDPEGGFRASLEAKESPRLGHEIGPDGTLARAAMDRGVQSMIRFRRLLKAWGDPRVIAVATSAVREAPNRSVFLDRVRKSTGVRVRVLSGLEEARYAFLGVATCFAPGNDLIVDAGGGSVQFIETRTGRIRRSESIPLGVLSASEKFLRKDPPGRGEVAEFRSAFRDALDLIFRPRLPRGGRLFGIGGTIRSLARFVIHEKSYPVPQPHGFPLRERDLEALEEILTGMDVRERRDLPGFDRSHADVALAGVILWQEILRWSGAAEVRVSRPGIREGIAAEALRISLPVPAEVLALRGAAALARDLGASLAHGEEAWEVARLLFQAGRRVNGWNREDGLALEVAARLHDLGMAIDRWHHPHHSSYILRHTILPGLTHREVAMAAIAVALHEGDSLPMGSLREWRAVLSEEDLHRALQLGQILNAAELLSGRPVHLRRSPRSRVVTMVPSHSWAAAHAPALAAKLTRKLEPETGLRIVVGHG